MENKILITNGNFVWLNVTEQVKAIFTAPLPIYTIEESFDKHIETLIEDPEQLLYCIGQRMNFFTPVGNATPELKCRFEDSWETAKKTTIEGELYIRTKDLIFIKSC